MEIERDRCHICKRLDIDLYSIGVGFLCASCLADNLDLVVSNFFKLHDSAEILLKEAQEKILSLQSENENLKEIIRVLAAKIQEEEVADKSKQKSL